MQNLKMRERAIEAVEILDTLESDFCVGTMVFFDYSDRFQRNEVSYGQMIDVRRMTLSYLVLNLRKIPEFRQKYAILLDKSHRDLLKPVQELIDSPGLIKVRNVFVAHAPRRKDEKPLTNNELANIFREISEDEQAFLRKIYNPDNPTDRETVCGIVRVIKKDILNDYQIKDEEMIQRYNMSLSD